MFTKTGSTGKEAVSHGLCRSAPVVNREFPMGRQNGGRVPRPPPQRRVQERDGGGGGDARALGTPEGADDRGDGRQIKRGIGEREMRRAGNGEPVARRRAEP